MRDLYSIRDFRFPPRQKPEIGPEVFTFEEGTDTLPRNLGN